MNHRDRLKANRAKHTTKHLTDIGHSEVDQKLIAKFTEYLKTISAEQKAEMLKSAEDGFTPVE